MIDPQVLIIGAGPAGLSAAKTLASRGVENVRLVDREPEAGGIPRFCPHPTFGFTDFKRPMTGPAYAQSWRKQINPDWISTSTSVLRIRDDLQTDLATPDGLLTVAPKLILLASGTREMSRAARLVSGDRPRKIFTTGALQRLLATGTTLPFRHPLVVGSELVSFSATLSLLEAGARPVAMLEAGDRIVTRRPADIMTRLLLAVPVHLKTRLVSINADANDARIMRSVTVADATGAQREIGCDAVIFTGKFVPETSIVPEILLNHEHAPAKVLINQNWQTNNPKIFAAGNILRAVETAAWCAREGAAAAHAIADQLREQPTPSMRNVPIVVSQPIELCLPTAIAVPGHKLGSLQMQIKMATAARGRFVLAADDKPFWTSSRMNALPQRRIGLTRDLPDLSEVTALRLTFEKD